MSDNTNKDDDTDAKLVKFVLLGLAGACNPLLIPVAIGGWYLGKGGIWAVKNGAKLAMAKAKAMKEDHDRNQQIRLVQADQRRREVAARAEQARLDVLPEVVPLTKAEKIAQLNEDMKLALAKIERNAGLDRDERISLRNQVMDKYLQLIDLVETGN